MPSPVLRTLIITRALQGLGIITLLLQRRPREVRYLISRHTAGSGDSGLEPGQWAPEWGSSHWASCLCLGPALKNDPGGGSGEHL